MKLIEAMKKIKDLQRKADDIRTKIGHDCVRSSIEQDKYDDPKAKISGWLQSHQDLMKEVLRLRIAIQRTNLETNVTIELAGKAVTKTIAEWIHRRRDMANLELQAYQKLTDKGIKEGLVQGPGGDPMELKIVRHYDLEHRDKMIDNLRSEPLTIDATLEISNAVTDLIE